MISWLATGPPGRVWEPPVSVVISVPADRFCTMPAAMKTTVPITATGSSTRSTIRVRSTQKLPRRSVLVRAIPRITATAIAIPTAADTKFCTARPAIWVRWVIVDSPEYACQLVLVTKLTAVFHATWS